MKLSLGTVRIIVGIMLIGILSNDYSNLHRAIERNQMAFEEPVHENGLLVVEESDQVNYDFINKREKKKTNIITGTGNNFIQGFIYEIEGFSFLDQNLIIESNIALNQRKMEMQSHFLSLQLLI